MAYYKTPNLAVYFNTSTDASNHFAPLGRHLHRRRLFYRLDRLIEVMEKTPGGVMIESRVTMAMHRYLNARQPLHIAIESFETDRLGWIAAKGSPLVAPINQV